ncbi:MAG: thrombospondin type 3 repeat-containing protein [Candidatus Woykebacteria bacterium]
MKIPPKWQQVLIVGSFVVGLVFIGLGVLSVPSDGIDPSVEVEESADRIIDLDNDDVDDEIDNCPQDANADQDDFDGDGIGSACDPDLDNDGVENGEDNCPNVPNENQAPGRFVDTYGNRLGDACDDLPFPVHDGPTSFNLRGLLAC